LKNHLKAVGNTVCLLALALFLAGCAQQPAVTPTSHGSTRDAALEKDFQTQLARIDPAAVPIYNQATAALDAKDYATAKKLYEQVGSMAPGFSAAFRRLGYIQSSLNDLEARSG
jgi:outer membrane protein assembly factor BamD (BamD/ComL family)